MSTDTKTDTETKTKTKTKTKRTTEDVTFKKEAVQMVISSGRPLTQIALGLLAFVHRRFSCSASLPKVPIKPTQAQYHPIQKFISRMTLTNQSQ